MAMHYPNQLILQGVPRIGFDFHLCPFPGSLYSILEYIGDPCDYDYLMAVTGAAFRRTWNRDDGGNVDLSYFQEVPFQRVFDALGYAWQSYAADREAMLSGIRVSLSNNVPAISFGIFGPPEAGLVTGYDRYGAVLYGWSYFQEQNQRYYEKEDWFETMEKLPQNRGLIVIGQRIAPRKTAQEVLRGVLEWALDLAHNSRRPEIPDHVCGLAAYDAWAEAVEVDADYPSDIPQTMDLRAMVYGDQATMLYERREAATFLRKAAQANPAADYLLKAAALYDQVSNATSLIWPWGVASNADAIPGLSNPAVRRQLAAAIRETGVKEARAVAMLEKALSVMKSSLSS